MKKLKQGDPVKVIAGKFKGKVSKIVSIDADLVIVAAVNVMKKAVKGKGFVDKIKPIHISNVMYYDEKAGTSRVGIVTDDKGKKTRILKKTKKTIA